MTTGEILAGFLDGLRPTERLRPTDWADEYRFLSSAASAEPGRWRTSRTPYLAEIMDCFDPYSPVEEVIFPKGAQIGASEAGFNIVGYFIDIAPCPIMYVMPTEGTIKRNSKMRLAPMIEASPRLRSKVSEAKSRDSGNTILQKDFPGGTLLLAGANSASGLRSVPVRVLILDEVDAFPLDLDGEGSPVSLAKARTSTF
jgi:phage terminase large subunit GpA-like protein